LIPLRDDVRSSTTPVVNWLMIGACAVVFLLQLGADQDSQDLVLRYGMIPKHVLHPDAAIRTLIGMQELPFGGVREVYADVPHTGLPAWLTLLTCVFLHGGWAHFLGNMWFLWIFGDNVEDRLGRLGYLAFYLGCGVAASLTHLAVNPDSTQPTIGASGAIAGVMGGYLLLYPHARVLTLVPLGFFLQLMELPALVFLGFWFLLQLFLGSMSRGMEQGGGGGVAFGAHVGGFVCGLVVVWILRTTGRLRPAPEVIRFQPRRMYGPWNRRPGSWP